LLLLTAHHLVLDGWSIPILLKRLLRLACGCPAVGPKADYLDYLEHLDTVDVEAAHRELLAGLEGLEEGSLVAGPRTQDLPGSRHEVTLELTGKESTALTEQARHLGVTPATLGQAAWAVVLSAARGRADVVV